LIIYPLGCDDYTHCISCSKGNGEMETKVAGEFDSIETVEFGCSECEEAYYLDSNDLKCYSKNL